MWTTNQLGLATWTDSQATWGFDARGGHAIQMATTDDMSESSLVRLRPVDQTNHPDAGEQFIRGKSWNVNYPQRDGGHALRIAFEPIESTANTLLLQTTISIQTDLLDTNPKLDVEVATDSIDSFATHGSQSKGSSDDHGCPPVSIARGPNGFIAVLLGPHDSPFTTNLSTPSSMRLRLFGEFLEKGVIRKAKPWILIDRSGQSPDRQQLETHWQQLRDSPLPLTP